MQKKVTITIDESLNDRWSNVAKKHKFTKSRIVEDMLEQLLPILEAKTPNKMMAEAMKSLGAQIDLTGDLFENIEEVKK